MLSVCNSSDLTAIDDAKYLYALVANSFASVVQFAFPQTIEAECDLLINGEGTPLQNLAEVIKRLFPAECLYVDYEGVINFYRSITEPFPGNNCKSAQLFILFLDSIFLQSVNTCIRRAPSSDGSPPCQETLHSETWFRLNFSSKLALEFSEPSE